jgi:hypothetical protein
LAAYGVACVIGITVATRLSDHLSLTVASVGAVVVVLAGLLFIFGDSNSVVFLRESQMRARSCQVCEASWPFSKIPGGGMVRTDRQIPRGGI